MGLININFSEAISKADRIIECGQDVCKQANHLRNTESRTAAAWCSDSSKLYLKKFDKNAVNIDNHAKRMIDNAGRLKKSAETLKLVEERGKAIFLK